MKKLPILSASVLLLLHATSFAQSSDKPVEVLTYLEPYRSIEISAIETGVIDEILVKEGDPVKKGDILLKLDTEIAEARLAISQTQAASTGKIMAMQAEYDVQKDRLEGLQALAQKGTPASMAELKRQQASLQIAEGNLTIAKEEQETYAMQVKQYQAELERRIFRSPIDGVVVEITKDIAEPVSVNQYQDSTFLVRVVQLDQLLCLGHVPASAARGLQAGDMLTVRVDDVQKTEAQGRLEFVSPIIDPATSTVRVRLVIDNAESRLRSGSSAMILVPVAAGE